MKLSLREKICYGIGTLGYGLENSMVAGYLLLFCTEALGIDALMIGSFMLLPKLLDIVTDILFMNKADKITTKYGTYRPWLVSAIPIGICLVLLFSSPDFLTTMMQKTIWVLIIYFMLVAIFETVYWCPYATLGMIISGDDTERLKLSSWRSAFENIAAIVVSALTIPIVLKFGETYKSLSGWKISAIIFSVLGIISMIICFLGIKERIIVDKKNLDSQPLKAKIKMFMNKPTFKLLSMMFLLFIPWYAYSALFSYFCIYNLGHEEWIPILSIIGIIISIACSLMAPMIAKKISKKTTIFLGALSMILGSFLFCFANNFYLLILVFLLKDFGQISVYVCTFAYVPELSDYINTSVKINSPGLVLGVVSAFQKISISLGTFLSTVILTLGKYNPQYEIQPTETAIAIRYGVVILYLISSVGIIMLIRGGAQRSPYKQ